MAEEELKDLEEIEQKHAYIEDSKYPQFMKKEELIADMSKLQENIGRKRQLIRTMNDKWKDIDNEIRRWENKNNMLKKFDENLKEEEKELNEQILKIRKARKEAGMDAMFKQYMGDALRKRIKNIVDSYGQIMEQPEEMVKAKMAAEKAEDNAQSINKITEMMRKKQEEKKQGTEQKENKEQDQK